MRLYQLYESLSTNILVVDVQPAYDKWAKKIVPNVVDLLSRHKGGKYIMYNGYNRFSHIDKSNINVTNNFTGEISIKDTDRTRLSAKDTESSVASYYVKNGFPEDRLSELQFIEKEYGFISKWMDAEVPNSIIIKTLRAMAQEQVKRSSELNKYEVLSPSEELKVFRCGIKWDYRPIYMPDFVSLSFLKNISPFLMCGGGKNACLREIELICNAFNIRYKRINSMLY